MDIEKIKTDVMGLLQPFGLDTSIDDFILDWQVDTTIQDIKNFCNLEELPAELEHVVTRRCFGSMLEFKLQHEGAEVIGADGDIKSITEGDTSISYDNTLSRGSMVAGLIRDAKTYGKNELYTFRKMRW